MNRTRITVSTLVLTATLALSAQALQGQRTVTAEERARRQAEQERSVQEELLMERPVAALNSVWIEELTWIEVRDAIASGKTTVIIPTGGVEQNGPYVATGKHNYILQTGCEMIARELGNALCAPIIKLVPEGNIDEPSGHMRYPGTISLREETYRAVLADVGASLQAHGFEHIIYIGDSGGNQPGQAAVAEELNQRWGQTIAHHIPEFYDNNGLIEYMEKELGITEPVDDGYHDYYWITVLMMVTDPEVVRYDQRVAAGKATINGVSIAPKEEAIEVGRKLHQWRVDQTAQAIRAAIR